MNCLLDTCVFLWLALEPKRIPARAASTINTAPRRFLSHTSIWEIVLKHSAGKLPMPESPRLWVPGRLEFFQIHLLPPALEAVFLSSDLPPVHRDPFDRLIAAESIQHRLTVVTPDESFSALGARRIWS